MKNKKRVLKISIKKDEEIDYKNDQQESSSFYREYEKPVKINDYLYMSDYSIIKKKNILDEYKIDYIFNLASKTCKNLNYDDIKYKEYDIRDNPGYDLLKLIKEIVNLIDNLVKDEKKIIVHCYKGISRAPSCIMAYLIMKKNMKMEETFEFLRTKVEKIDPNMSFLCQLEKLEEK